MENVLWAVCAVLFGYLVVLKTRGAIQPLSFGGFDDQALRSIELAKEESRRLGHNFVGTEAILLGLLMEEGIAAKALNSAGASRETARVEVETIIGHGTGFIIETIPFTPRARKVIEFARAEARKLRSKHIGIEHLLLGVLGDSDGVAMHVLQNLQVDPLTVKSELKRLLDERSDRSTSA